MPSRAYRYVAAVWIGGVTGAWLLVLLPPAQTPSAVSAAPSVDHRAGVSAFEEPRVELAEPSASTVTPAYKTQRPAAAARSGAAQAPACLPFRLSGVLKTGAAERGSYAMIAHGDEPAAIYSIGERVGRMRVGSIRDKAVQLEDSTGKRCSLELASGASSAVRPLKSRSDSASNLADFGGLEDGLSTSDFERFVRPIGEGRYEVRRAFMEAVINSIGIIPASTPVDPSAPPAPSDAATKSGFLRFFGLQDGDTIEAFNSHSVHTRADVIQAFAHARDASSIRLSVQRASQTLVLEYALR